MATQYPTSTLAIGGQPTVSGYDVINSTFGFEEDKETFQNADGVATVDIVFDRRKTLSLELQAQSGSTGSEFESGGTVSIGGTTYLITSASIAKTRGPIVVSLELIEQATGNPTTTTTTTA